VRGRPHPTHAHIFVYSNVHVTHRRAPNRPCTTTIARPIDRLPPRPSLAPALLNHHCHHLLYTGQLPVSSTPTGIRNHRPAVSSSERLTLTTATKPRRRTRTFIHR
jgi:hypothetical protein